MQQGVQTPGVLKQPEDPQGAVWGPAPSCVCARACPCQLQGQHYTPWGSPSSLCLGFSISFSPARDFRETWCPDSNASKENNQMRGQTGRRAGLEPGHGQQPSVQTLPRSHRCLLPLLAENSVARAGAWGLAAPRSCWWRFSSWFQDESVGVKVRLASCFQPGCGWQMGRTLASLRAGPCLHSSQHRQGIRTPSTSTWARHHLPPSTRQEGIAHGPVMATGSASGSARLRLWG